MYLQNLELLEFSVVFAFPNASSIGPEFRIFCFIKSFDSAVSQRKSIRLEQVLVFPAPDIPDIMNDWFLEHRMLSIASFAKNKKKRHVWPINFLKFSSIFRYLSIPKEFQQILTYSIDVWRKLADGFSIVALNFISTIQIFDFLIWVNGNEYFCGVSLQKNRFFTTC